MEMKLIDKVSYSLLVIGGLNWGVVGLFEKDIVGEIFGYGSTLAKALYVVIGAAGIYGVYTIVTMMSAQKKSSTKA